MLNWFRRNLVNIVIALAVSIPICFMAHNERADREAVIVKESSEVEIINIDNIVDTTVTPNEVAMATVAEVSEEDIELLAHLLYAEAGSSWISDETIFYVGSVVLNRVNSDLFPDTLYDVIYQPGQYACTWDGNIEKEPTERCYEIAEELLRNGSVLPENVVFQASFKQGSGVYAYQDNLYFCYH